MSDDKPAIKSKKWIGFFGTVFGIFLLHGIGRPLDPQVAMAAIAFAAGYTGIQGVADYKKTPQG